MKLRFLAILSFVALSMTSIAQNKDLTLEDLNFGGTNYRNMRPETRYTTWWGDQLVHLDVEDCFTVKTDKKGVIKETKLFTLKDINSWLSLSGNDKIRSLYYAEFPWADKTYAVVENQTKRYVVDFKAKKLVSAQSSEGSLEWNAASSADAFLRNDNLGIRTAEGSEYILTTDGSREIVYGQAVHRNEFGIMKGTFFSPDGKRMAFYRMDQSMVTDYPQVNTFERSATYEPDKYPMAGMTSHKVTIGVADFSRQGEKPSVIYLNLGDVTDRYFSNIQWNKDGSLIYLYELNRAQNHQTLDVYDATTGQKVKTLYTESSEKYVEPLHPIEFLPWNDSQFLYWSWRDGFTHLYIMDTDGNDVRQLTSGNWVVTEILGFNAKTHSVIIASKECHDLQQNIFAVNIDNGQRTLLDSGNGVHHGMLSASGLYVLDNYSAPETPRNIDILTTTATSKGAVEPKRYFTAANPWGGYNIPIFESGSIKAADGVTDLYWRMVKPHDFDPAKKYPTVVYVYGGPHAHNVDASWHWLSRGWESYMASKGYITFILDNRGSENRGRDFEQVTWHHLGQEEMRDQMCGVEYLKSLPYVDAERLGVHGWSYGGYMTISLMTNYPDVFKVGVAGGPVIDWKWYEVMYGERYMGTPESNPEGYAQTSLLAKAKNLEGRLQIIIGMNDPTVVPQHALQFLNECSEAGTQPDFYVYPGEGHNMRGHKSVHLHERITRYFEDYLK